MFPINNNVFNVWLLEIKSMHHHAINHPIQVAAVSSPHSSSLVIASLNLMQMISLKTDFLLSAGKISPWISLKTILRSKYSLQDNKRIKGMYSAGKRTLTSENRKERDATSIIALPRCTCCCFRSRTQKVETVTIPQSTLQSRNCDTIER